MNMRLFHNFLIDRALLIVTILVAVAFPSKASGAIEEDGDFQLWLFNSVHKKLSEKQSLYLEGELRYGNNASTLYLFYLQARLLYTINERLKFYPGYRQLYFLSVSDRRWEAQYEPFLDIIAIRSIKNWEITDRNRFSYLFFEERENRWQYRNRLMIKTPWKIGKMQFNPLVFDEVFFREKEDFRENRFGLGGEIPFFKNRITLLYVIRSRKFQESWRRSNILWLQLNSSF